MCAHVCTFDKNDEKDLMEKTYVCEELLLCRPWGQLYKERLKSLLPVSEGFSSEFVE